MGHSHTVTQVTLGQECWVGRQMMFWAESFKGSGKTGRQQAYRRDK